MSGDAMTAEHAADALRRLGRVGGWAPGEYLGKCHACGQNFWGDKRAASCLSCAVGALRDGAAQAAAQFRSYEAQHHAKGTPEAYAKAKVNATWATALEALSAH